MPLMLLKQTEPNALNLRSIRTAVVALRQHAFRVIAVFILAVLLKSVTGLRILLRLFVAGLCVCRDFVGAFKGRRYVMVFFLAFVVAILL